MSELLQALVEEESRPADLGEILYIEGLGHSPQEASILTASGFTRSQVKEGRFRRGDLLEADVVFMNRIGGGEKPLIAGSIPWTESDDGTLDTTLRTVLTQDEIRHIQVYQQAFREKAGYKDFNSEDIREKMLEFLLASIVEYEKGPRRGNQLFRQAQARILETAEAHEKQALSSLISGAFKDEESGVPTLRFLMSECLAGIDISFVDHIPIAVVPTRMSMLEGQPSPFLDSGFRFSINPDVTIYPNNPCKTRRLNMVAVHMLSRGLDEMGSSANGSHDQTYVTGSEFLELATIAQEARDTNAEVALVMGRLLARASR